MSALDRRTERCPRCGNNVEVIDGSIMRQIRKECGMTLRQFAKRVGVSAPYVHEVETGKRRVTPRMYLSYQSLRAARSEERKEQG